MLVSADRVGDAHEDGGVSRRHVQVVDPEACPGEAAQPQGEREEGGGGAAGHDQGGQRHEERLSSDTQTCERCLTMTMFGMESTIFVSHSADLAEVGAAREQFPDVGGGQLAVSADGVSQVAADLRVL